MTDQISDADFNDSGPDGRVHMQGPRSPSPSLIAGGGSPLFLHTFERLDHLVDHVGHMTRTIQDMRADFHAQCAELAAAQEESARRHALLADRVTELENRPLTNMMPPPSPAAAAPSGPSTDVFSEMVSVLTVLAVSPPAILKSLNNPMAISYFLQEYENYKKRTMASERHRVPLLDLLHTGVRINIQFMMRIRKWSAVDALRSYMWTGTNPSALRHDLAQCAMSNDPSQYTIVALQTMTHSFMMIVEAATVKDILLPQSQLVKLYQGNIRPKQQQDALLVDHGTTLPQAIDRAHINYLQFVEHFIAYPSRAPSNYSTQSVTTKSYQGTTSASSPQISSSNSSKPSGPPSQGFNPVKSSPPPGGPVSTRPVQQYSGTPRTSLTPKPSYQQGSSSKYPSMSSSTRSDRHSQPSNRPPVRTNNVEIQLPSTDEDHDHGMEEASYSSHNQDDLEPSFTMDVIMLTEVDCQALQPSITPDTIHDSLVPRSLDEPQFKVDKQLWMIQTLVTSFYDTSVSISTLALLDTGCAAPCIRADVIQRLVASNVDIRPRSYRDGTITMHLATEGHTVTLTDAKTVALKVTLSSYVRQVNSDLELVKPFTFEVAALIYRSDVKA